MIENLRPFQRTFLRNALRPGIWTSALSLARGNGKSALAGHLLERHLRPDDPLFQAGKEVILIAGSLEQARTVYRFVVEGLGNDNPDYRYLDSTTSIGITHKASKTRLRVRSSNARTAMGLAGVSLVVADEPGAWAVNEGSLMHTALTGAQGKPESLLKLVYIGTVSPAGAGGWWPAMIEAGSHGSTYCQSVQGDANKWDDLREVRRCNPLIRHYPESMAKLKEELKDAYADTSLKADFCSYRLNTPQGDEQTMLLTVDQWQKLLARPVADREGAPIVAADIGMGRAWTAACAVWRSGRVESVALCGGIPGIKAMEKRDRIPQGTYQKLVDLGLLVVADGLEVPPPEYLWTAIKERWGRPLSVVCDRFRFKEFRQAIKGECPLEGRVSQWSESTLDIRALWRYAVDGPLSIPENDRPLLAASLSVAMVDRDLSGNVRMVKGSANTARDDIAECLKLVAGAYWRAESADQPRELAYAVVG